MFSWTGSIRRSLSLGLIAGLLTALGTLWWPNYYRSEAKVLPVDSKGGTGGLGGIASAAAAFGVNLTSADGGDANFMDILASRTIREQLLESEFAFRFRRHYLGREQYFKGKLRDFLGNDNPDQSVRSLLSMITLSRDLKSRVISLEVETISPELSQLMVRRMLELLERFVQERGRTRGGAKAIYSTSRLTEAKQELLAAEEQFKVFVDRNRNYATTQDSGVRLAGARLEAEMRLKQQIVSTLALSREQASLEEKNDIPIVNILDAGNLPFEKSKPSRSETVLFVAFLSAIANWSWLNRRQLKSFLSLGEGVK